MESFNLRINQNKIDKLFIGENIVDNYETL